MSKKCDKIKPGTLVRYRNPYWANGTAIVTHRLVDWTTDEHGYWTDGIVVRWLDVELSNECPVTTEYPWDLEVISD